MNTSIPRFILAGLSGGTGKTIISLALARTFSRFGLRISPFKKGPDYIDAKWLGLAANAVCSNLDPYFHTDEVIRSLFWHKSQDGELSIIEGNRGLFDGMDEHGVSSTAELARKLDAPVILVIDCTKMTRTVAAIIQGCANLEPDLNLAGVILNRTAGERHRLVLKKSIEAHTDIPVLGMFPKIPQSPIPERHMGLISDQEYGKDEHGSIQHALDSLADMAKQRLELNAILSIAKSATPFGANPGPLYPGTPAEKKARIGYVHDAALWFYYPENLEALEHAGAELVPLSILSGEPWPDLDGLYLGGGFPEIFAEQIASNTRTLGTIRGLAHAGKPIYAECGGFMVLCDFLQYQNQTHSMAGVFPVTTTFHKRPQGLGYTQAQTMADSVFFPAGTMIMGHEFHYSRCVNDTAARLDFIMKMKRGKGLMNEFDGIHYKNTLAGYTHIHALAVPGWADHFVAAAKRIATENGIGESDVG